MSARSRILGNIRSALGRGALAEESQVELRERMVGSGQGIRPVFEQNLCQRFIEKVQSVSGTVDRVSGKVDVPEAVQRYLAANNVERKLVISGGEILDDLTWPKSFQVDRRPADGKDYVSVTGAFSAIAETGTLVLLSGPNNPTTLNFLPDDHIVVLGVQQIVPHIEDVWRLIKDRGEGMPRTVNLITGPSRTADVEQTIQLGAHGPRRLHVVIIDLS